MANNYYDHTTWPAVSSSGSSSSARDELDLIEVGFDGIQSDLEDGSLWGTPVNLDILSYNSSSGLIEHRTVAELGMAALESPALTGIPTAPTASADVGTAQLATCAHVAAVAFSPALPAQSGNSGKFVTTDGTNASWAVAITPTGSQALTNKEISDGTTFTGDALETFHAIALYF